MVAGRREAWRRYTAGAFSMETFPGGHFFVETARAALLRSVERQLSAAPTRSRSVCQRIAGSPPRSHSIGLPGLVGALIPARSKARAGSRLAHDSSHEGRLRA